MLIRDNVGKTLSEALKDVKDKDFEIVKLETNEDFFQALISKIKSEIEILEKTKSLDSLAEILELVDWINISLGLTNVSDLIESRAEKLGLYWEKYYIKDKVEESE